ncbi:hypothetical protein [Lysobacter sp. HA35]
MDLITLWTLHTLVAGFAGLAAHGRIAAIRTSEESIDSLKLGRRWMYRYLLFSLAYMASFFVSPVLLSPLLKLDWFTHFDADHKKLLFALGLLPLAIVLFAIDLRFIRWCDQGKIDAREKLGWRARNRGL